MKVLIDTIFQLLPGLLKIFAFGILITMIFSILGMNFFWSVKVVEPLDEYTNF